VLGTASSRVLGVRDAEAVRAVVGRDPLVNVFVGSRISRRGWRSSGEIWGWDAGGRLDALCYSGANLVPVECGPDAIAAFAERARRQGRRCSSVVGPTEMVEPLWERLEPYWGRPRAIRSRQPFLAIDQPPDLARDPLVRRVRPDELEVLLPAAVAMFTEEVGVSPLGHDAAAYRSRVQDLVGGGQAYARIEDGRVVFKADVTAVTDRACQIQGVWVAPERRGEGLAAPAMAAVVAAVLAEHAPAATLYVNDFNEVARRAYARVGFTEIATFTTVLF
jgi:uncharacterized protein